MAGYIGSKASVVSSGAERKKVFAITTTTTSLTGLTYTPTKVHVYHNGIRLVDGTDYTATNGTSITLTNAAESGDEVVVVSYATFQVADAYTQAEADAEFVNDPNDVITVSGSNVGIGTSSPAALLEVHNNSGAAAVNVRGSTDTIIRARQTSNTGFGYFSFGRSEDIFVGGLAYDHGGDNMRLYANNAERMRIDSAGRVTMLYQPAFNARVNENTAYNATGWNQIEIGNLMNQRGSHYNTSTSRFTAPVSGWYHMSMSVVFNAGNDNDGAISLGINGGVSNRGIGVNQAKNGGTYSGKSASGSVYMTAGDYAEVYVYLTAAMTTRGSIYAGYFSGHLIG